MTAAIANQRCGSTYHGLRCELPWRHPGRHAEAMAWDDEGRVEDAIMWTDAEAMAAFGSADQPPYPNALYIAPGHPNTAVDF